jgi:hypothetical protein
LGIIILRLKIKIKIGISYLLCLRLAIQLLCNRKDYKGKILCYALGEEFQNENDREDIMTWKKALTDWEDICRKFLRIKRIQSLNRDNSKGF